jgi:hypothetical protein
MLLPPYTNTMTGRFLRSSEGRNTLSVRQSSAPTGFLNPSRMSSP